MTTVELFEIFCNSQVLRDDNSRIIRDICNGQPVRDDNSRIIWYILQRSTSS